MTSQRYRKSIGVTIDNKKTVTNNLFLLVADLLLSFQNCNGGERREHAEGGRERAGEGGSNKNNRSAIRSARDLSTAFNSLRINIDMKVYNYSASWLNEIAISLVLIGPDWSAYSRSKIFYSVAYFMVNTKNMLFKSVLIPKINFCFVMLLY